MNQANLKEIENDLMKFSASSLSEQWNDEMDGLFAGLNLEIPGQKSRKIHSSKKQNAELSFLSNLKAKVSQKIQSLQLNPLKLRGAQI